MLENREQACGFWKECVKTWASQTLHLGGVIYLRNNISSITPSEEMTMTLATKRTCESFLGLQQIRETKKYSSKAP